MESIYDDILEVGKELGRTGAYKHLGEPGKIGTAASSVQSIVDDVDKINQPTEGGWEAVAPTGKPIADITQNLIGGYSGTSWQSGQESAVEIAENMMSGDMSKNILDITERANVGTKLLDKGSYPKETPGLLSKEGEIGKLATNKVLVKGAKLAKAGGKKILDEIATNPNLAPAQEIVEGGTELAGEIADKIEPVITKVKDVAKPVVENIQKVLASKTAKVAGGVASVAGGVFTAVEGGKELAAAGGNVADKTGAGMQVAGGTGAALAGGAAVTAALTGTAAANFWNPIGWVSAALAIGGTMVTMFGGEKGGRRKRFGGRKGDTEHEFDQFRA